MNRGPRTRSERVVERMGDALVAWMLEKPFDDITVQEIIQRAKVARSTFYLHFSGKEDLLALKFEQTLEGMLALARPGEGGRLLDATGMLNYVEANRPVFEAMACSRGVNVLFDAADPMLAMTISEQLKGRALPAPREVTSHCAAGAFLGLLRWWVVEEMPFSAEEMGEMYAALVHY